MSAENKKVLVSIRLEKDTYQNLDEYSKKTGLKKYAIAQNAIDEYLEKQCQKQN